MVSTTCMYQESLSVAFWRFFECIQLFELHKHLVEHVLGELLSNPSGYSYSEAYDICHAFSAFS